MVVANANKDGEHGIQAVHKDASYIGYRSLSLHEELCRGWSCGARGRRRARAYSWAWSSPHSVQCFALLHCSANQISAECCLAFATPGGYRKFLGYLGQLPPTTLPQCRLRSNLSLCGRLSLSVLSLRPPKGVCLPLHPPHWFLSIPLFPWALPRLTPPPSTCPCYSGVPPFARE